MGSVSRRGPKRACESAPKDTKTLLVPDFKRTSKWAEDVSLLGAVMTWNVPVRGKACCPFHAYLMEATKATTRLERQKCKPDFRLEWVAQCEVCGLLAPWGNPAGVNTAGIEAQECSACGRFSVHVRRGPSVSL